MNIALLTSSGSIIQDLWDGLQLNASLQSMIDGVGGQVQTLLPIGITLLFVMAVPRIVKRIIHTFL